MLADALEGGDHAGPGAAEVLAERDEVPGRCQRLVVADLLQLADGLAAPLERLLGGERGVGRDPQLVKVAAGAKLEGAISQRARKLQSLLSTEPGLPEVARVDQRLGQLEQELDAVLAPGLREGDRASEQVRRARPVTHHQ